MLRNHLLPALQVVSTGKPAMRSILTLVDSIQAGKSPALTLRFIDLEYNSANRRVFEIGMCGVNGTPTMDCLTLYGSKNLHAVIKDNTVVERRMDDINESCVKQTHCAHHISNHDDHAPRAVREESPRYYRRSAAETHDGRLWDTIYVGLFKIARMVG